MTRLFTRASLKNFTPRKEESARLEKLDEWVDERLNGYSEKVDFEAEEINAEEIVKLFKKKENFFKVIEVLQRHELLREDGSFKGFSGFGSEIVCLIDILDEKGYLNRSNQTKRGRLFCDFFGVELKDRSLRTKSQAYSDNWKEYLQIIPNPKSI